MECIKEQYEFDNYSLEVERIKLSIVTDLCFYNGHPFHMAHGEWNKVVQHAAAEYTSSKPSLSNCKLALPLPPTAHQRHPSPSSPSPDAHQLHPSISITL